MYTMDLTTGELTWVCDFMGQYYMPWAMTFVDGTLYAVKYYYAGLFTVDTTTGDMTAVTDADGNKVMPKNSAGNNASPLYAQSMTYSKADGKIYWAFYTSNWSGETADLISIDVEDWTCTAVPFATSSEYVGLLTLEEDDYTLPEAEAMKELTLSAEDLVLIEGETAVLKAGILPWNYEPEEEIVWTSDDTSVATVEDGVVTAVSEGYATITASCEGVTVSCDVTVVDVTGTVHLYDYYDAAGNYGYWADLDLESMTMDMQEATPVDFIAADYNGHDGNVYGYDMNGQFYRYNRETRECTALGTPVSSVPVDLAYDYANGYMYAMTIDQMAWTSTLCYVNMNTGALVEVASTYDIYMTLACDMDGTLFAISSEGILYYLSVMSGSAGGIMPWSEAAEMAEEGAEDETLIINAQYLMEGLGSLNYAQSMCYHHEADVLIWACPEASTVYWIDPYGGYVLDLGDPTNSGLLEFIGMYTVPEEIPELAEVAVESVTADDMLLMVGGSKNAAINIDPLNATSQDYTLVSSDESIVSVGENGILTGVAEGTVTVTVTLVDQVSGETFEYTFTVTVKNSAGMIHGYIASELAYGSGQVWAAFSDQDPTNDISYLAACDYFLYAEEYVDGKLYAYGYDPYDWEANFLYMVIDAETYEIESMTDMGDGFPFVYDMTYDYTTGTMYAVAGYNSNSSDLYMVNMNSGDLVYCMSTEPFFTSLAANAEGELYGISASEDVFDEETYSSYFTNAMLYKFDVAAGTYEVVFDLGVCNNKLSSMTFDLDTGNLYWAQMFQASFWDPYVDGLYLIDIENENAYNLGLIGPAGSQLTGMYIVADNYPEVPDGLISVALNSTMEDLNVGETVTLETFLQPSDYEGEMVWSSADETIATVDENGVVTAVGAGMVEITVTVDGMSATCIIIVYGEADYFLVYNTTDNGFSSIDRVDTTLEETLTSAEAYADVRSMDEVDGVIYGFDAENKFFKITDLETYEREYLGEATADMVELPEDETGADYYFVVRDLAWDSANERLLAVVCKSVHAVTDYGDYVYESDYELVDGCQFYEVDLETGELTYLSTSYTASGEYISNVYTLTVDDNGVAYTYSSYDDYVCVVDVDTGVVTKKTTMQNQGVYGDSDGNPMAMDYDSLTGMVYMLFTQNGNFYQMVSYDPSSAQLEIMGYVGEYADYSGNAYAGLIVYSGDYELTEEVCEHADVKLVGFRAPTTTEPGYTGDWVCQDCGDIVKQGTVLPATGGTVQPGPNPSGPNASEDDEDVDLPFVDVDEDDWFYGDVEYVYGNGLMNGVDDTHFAPDDTLTRGMIVTILYRMEGEPAVHTFGTFDDVDVYDDWFGEAVEWAAKNGIVKGYDNGNFGPYDAITREQLAAILFRYAGFKGYDVSARADLSKFTDADSVSAYAVEAMQWAVAEGLINGANGALMPQASATRAQVAAIIRRFLED